VCPGPRHHRAGPRFQIFGSQLEPKPSWHHNSRFSLIRAAALRPPSRALLSWDLPTVLSSSLPSSHLAGICPVRPGEIYLALLVLISRQPQLHILQRIAVLPLTRPLCADVFAVKQDSWPSTGRDQSARRASWPLTCHHKVISFVYRGYETPRRSQCREGWVAVGSLRCHWQ
jgi:hypothetical protein